MTQSQKTSVFRGVGKKRAREIMNNQSTLKSVKVSGKVEIKPTKLLAGKTINKE